VLTIPSTLAPSLPDAGRYIVSSRFRCQSNDCGFVVRRLYTIGYRLALLRRVLLMGQQVGSGSGLSPPDNHFRDFSGRTIRAYVYFFNTPGKIHLFRSKGTFPDPLRRPLNPTFEGG
jgi:hypothetical protein